MQKVFKWRQSLQVSSPSKFSMPESFKATKTILSCSNSHWEGILICLRTHRMSAHKLLVHELCTRQPRNKLSDPKYLLCHLSNPYFKWLWEQAHGCACRSLEIVADRCSIQWIGVELCRIVWIISCLCSIHPATRSCPFMLSPSASSSIALKSLASRRFSSIGFPQISWTCNARTSSCH